MTVFSVGDYWWVVPVLAVHVGGIAGAWLYTGIVQGRYYTHTEDTDTGDTDNKHTGDTGNTHTGDGKTDTSHTRTGPGTNYLQVSLIIGNV